MKVIRVILVLLGVVWATLADPIPVGVCYPKPTTHQINAAFCEFANYAWPCIPPWDETQFCALPCEADYGNYCYEYGAGSHSAEECVYLVDRSDTNPPVSVLCQPKQRLFNCTHQQAHDKCGHPDPFCRVDCGSVAVDPQLGCINNCYATVTNANCLRQCRTTREAAMCNAAGQTDECVRQYMFTYSNTSCTAECTLRDRSPQMPACTSHCAITHCPVPSTFTCSNTAPSRQCNEYELRTTCAVSPSACTMECTSIDRRQGCVKGDVTCYWDTVPNGDRHEPAIRACGQDFTEYYCGPASTPTTVSNCRMANCSFYSWPEYNQCTQVPDTCDCANRFTGDTYTCESETYSSETCGCPDSLNADACQPENLCGPYVDPSPSSCETYCEYNSLGLLQCRANNGTCVCLDGYGAGELPCSERILGVNVTNSTIGLIHERVDCETIRFGESVRRCGGDVSTCTVTKETVANLTSVRYLDDATCVCTHAFGETTALNYFHACPLSTDFRRVCSDSETRALCNSTGAPCQMDWAGYLIPGTCPEDRSTLRACTPQNTYEWCALAAAPVQVPEHALVNESLVLPPYIWANAHLYSTGNSVVNCNVALGASANVVGVPPGTIHGVVVHRSTLSRAVRYTFLNAIAYINQLLNATNMNVTTPLTSFTLRAGVYTNAAAVTITSGNVTFDAQGDPNAQFHVRLDSNLMIGAGVQFVLINGALESNIFLVTAGGVQIGANSLIRANILAQGVIAVGSGSTVHGRLYSNSWIELTSATLECGFGDDDAPISYIPPPEPLINPDYDTCQVTTGGLLYAKCSEVKECGIYAKDLCSAGAERCRMRVTYVGNGIRDTVTLVPESCRCYPGFSGEFCQVDSADGLPCATEDSLTHCGPVNSTVSCTRRSAPLTAVCECANGRANFSSTQQCAGYLVQSNNPIRDLGAFGKNATLVCTSLPQSTDNCRVYNYTCQPNGYFNPSTGYHCGTNIISRPANSSELLLHCGVGGDRARISLTMNGANFVASESFVSNSCHCMEGYYAGGTLPCSNDYYTRTCTLAEAKLFCSTTSCSKRCTTGVVPGSEDCYAYEYDSCLDNYPRLAVLSNMTDAQLLCGAYVQTAVARCANFSVYTGPYNCNTTLGNAASQCTCKPNSYAADGLPCAQNYYTQACQSTDEAIHFCGHGGAGCVKRCTPTGCYEAESCSCQDSQGDVTSGLDYCGAMETAERCDTLDRPVCGPFTAQVSKVCDGPSCTTYCQCMSGYGTMPGSSVQCDGYDKPCLPEEVTSVCGGTSNTCKRRCPMNWNLPVERYRQLAVSAQGVIVGLGGSTVNISTLSADDLWYIWVHHHDNFTQSGCVPIASTCADEWTASTQACSADELAQCGPGAASCTKFCEDEDVCGPPSCHCKADSLPSAFYKCDSWDVDRACQPEEEARCGSFSVPSQCRVRRFVTPETGNTLWSVQVRQEAISSSTGFIRYRDTPATSLSHLYYQVQCSCLSVSNGVAAPVYTGLSEFDPVNTELRGCDAPLRGVSVLNCPRDTETGRRCFGFGGCRFEYTNRTGVLYGQLTYHGDGTQFPDYSDMTAIMFETPPVYGDRLNQCGCVVGWTGAECSIRDCPASGSACSIGFVGQSTLCSNGVDCKGIFNRTTAIVSGCVHGTYNWRDVRCDCDDGWGSGVTGACTVPACPVNNSTGFICSGPTAGTCNSHICSCIAGKYGAACEYDNYCSDPMPEHATGCDFTTGEWTCASTEDGTWSGAVCDTFLMPSCIHGEVTEGESPRYIGTPRPHAAHCLCDENWVGNGCDVSECPIGSNGEICSGHGTCYRGTCRQIYPTLEDSRDELVATILNHHTALPWGTAGVGDALMWSNIFGPSFPGNLSISRTLRCGNEDLWGGCTCSHPLHEYCRRTTLSFTCSGVGVCRMGQTISQNITYQCDCPPDRHGQFCELSRCSEDAEFGTECNSQVYGSTCAEDPLNAPGTYTCSCAIPGNITLSTPLYAGPSCTVNASQGCGTPNGVCDGHGVCSPSTECVNDPSSCTESSYTCVCHPGYNETRCTNQIACPISCNHGYCNLVNGQPQCQCYNRWVDDDNGAACNITNCPVGNHPSEDSLTATCVCDNGATYISPDCLDIACQQSCGGISDTCGPDGLCVCSWFNYKETETGPCIPRCSGAHVSSSISSGSGNMTTFVGCSCEPGYDPETLCAEPICQNNGVYQVNTETCLCPFGYQGDYCEIDICGAHGHFSNGACVCFFPWTGLRCLQHTCEHGAVPVTSPETSPDDSCECVSPYGGRQCEIDGCRPYGTYSTEEEMCVCEDVYHTGTLCSVSACANGGSFVSNTHSCSCTAQFTGTFCTDPVCGEFGLLNTETQLCECDGVYAPNPNDDDKCTLAMCGRYGTPDDTLNLCHCTNGTVPRSSINVLHPVACELVCTSGLYSDSLDACVCTGGYTGRLCNVPPTVSSSTAAAIHSSSSSAHASSTGVHVSSTAVHISSTASITHLSSSSSSTAAASNSTAPFFATNSDVPYVVIVGVFVVLLSVSAFIAITVKILVAGLVL